MRTQQEEWKPALLKFDFLGFFFCWFSFFFCSFLPFGSNVNGKMAELEEGSD